MRRQPPHESPKTSPSDLDLTLSNSLQTERATPFQQTSAVHSYGLTRVTVLVENQCHSLERASSCLRACRKRRQWLCYPAPDVFDHINILSALCQ